MTDHDAAAIALEYFSVDADVHPLPGYSDLNFKLSSSNGTFTLRLSNPDSDPGEFEFQTLVLRALADTGLTAPNPVRTRSGDVWSEVDGGWYARLFTWVPGTSFSDHGRPPGAAHSIGRTAGVCATALKGLDHPAADRESEWNILSAADSISAHMEAVSDYHRRSLIDEVVERTRGIDLSSLPHQVIHNDLNDDNVLIEGEHVTGVIDVGDSIGSVRIGEAAIAAAYSMLGQDDPLAVASSLLAGFSEIVDVTKSEAEVIFDLIIARLATSVVHSARRGAANPHHVKSETEAWDLLERLEAADHKVVRAQLSDAVGHGSAHTQSLRSRRETALGPSLSLSYEEPIHVVRGSGQYLFDETGRRYLDAVNNVPHVGHSNPEVAKAISRQAHRLNTNTRYLHHAVVDYSERLANTLPEILEVVYLVNSGSEANELAIRMARAATGSFDVACLEHGYHGNTTTLVDVSHYKFAGPGGEGERPWVVTLPVPDPYRRPEFKNPRLYRQAVDQALKMRSDPIAALIAESIPGVAGQVMPSPRVLREAYESVRIAGGLVIADEIQAGLGRVGDAFWSFQLHDVVPDIVTMGKPIGNGHPLAAVVTTRAIADAFDNGMEYFNTFGGNPVSVAAGMAVLDVIEVDRLQQRAKDVGSFLKTGLTELMGTHSSIGDVRGAGLFLGIEVVSAELAKGVVESAKADGVLLSTDGPQHNVIKIKPPLVFNEANAERLFEVIDKGLSTG